MISKSVPVWFTVLCVVTFVVCTILATWRFTTIIRQIKKASMGDIPMTKIELRKNDNDKTHG